MNFGNPTELKIEPMMTTITNVQQIQSTADRALLSTKNIPPRERLIFALDVATVEEAKQLVTEFGEEVVFYKIGIQLLLSGGNGKEGYAQLIDWLVEREKKVMVDMKMFDIAETVRAGVKQLRNRGVTFATVHGTDPILKAAVESRDGVNILAVTVLTSLDQSDIEDLGFRCNIEELVLSRAKRALALKCDGVISSGIEVRALRQEFGHEFVIAVPGIRPVENRVVDDQKRVADIEAAFLNGADYIVVGRPIRNATNPKAKAQEFQRRIVKLFEH
jgi:orotidine-5'-phosphate decarboxylase